MNLKVLKHFQSTDPILFSFIARIESFDIEKSDDFFASLCEGIIGQQLSGKVADVIFARFLKLFPKDKITPEKLLSIPDETVRGVGTSWAKVKSLKDLAAKVQGKEVILETLHALDDATVIKELSKVKGIGPWTAEMFLMFTLGREDIFSFGDLGLRRGIQKLYKLKKEPTLKQMEKISNKWKPYRTYAARILWSSLDTPGVV